MKMGWWVVPCLVVLAQPVRADMVTDWNEVFIDTVRITGGPPCPISRSAALLNVAMFDALNSIEKTCAPYQFSMAADPGASVEAAVAGAAHHVLSALYPAHTATFDAALVASLATVPDGPGEDAGLTLGQNVAAALLAARATDGTDVDPPYVFGTNPGDYRPTFPDFTMPRFSPGWGLTTPWTMTSGDQFRPGPPAGFPTMAALLASPEYADQVNEVKSLGALASVTRTPHETETALFWANDANGTFKPPGHLLYITKVVAQDQGLSLSDTARLFALVSLGMADAGVVAWDVKYQTDIDLWRPITAIREADTDGNPATTADPLWEPLLPFSPPFPAYTSGHSTFGAVHAAVMAGFFGTDAITFTVTSDDTPGVFRTYTSFSQAALENGRSRVFLGVHYQFDADAGYQSGTALGQHVIQTQLKSLGRFVRGDSNDDSEVNVADAIWTLSELFQSGPSSPCPEASDSNDDGAVNIADAQFTLNYLFSGGPTPAAPFGACGTDPDVWAQDCAAGAACP